MEGMDLFFFVILIFLLVIILLHLWQLRRSRADGTPLAAGLNALQDAQERTDRSLRDEIARLRTETQSQSQRERQELTATLQSFGDSFQVRMTEIARMQHEAVEGVAGRISTLTASNEKKLEDIRLGVDGKLGQIQQDNARQLDRMRETVDEKLQGALEKRLGESFKQVSERLEQVHQGLGDMRSLAAGVGDLKKVLTNVKSRGTWGEVQLGALLAEILSPDQYLQNVRIREEGADFVEFAIRLPGQGDSPDDSVLIPVDAKFPVEDYSRLIDAQERGDAAAAEEAIRQLETGIRKAARDISQKYLAPPRTTDFGIMFLPSEGLYAEVIRRTVLVSFLQRECRIVIAGPSTFAAFLNSLQMGFRTLAIQKRSGEVWKVLGEVKAAFGRFGESLDMVRKRLDQAAGSVDDAQKKTRTLTGKLKAVESLPDTHAQITVADTEADG